MSERYDYGPLRTYQIIWRSGHIETVQGHQVTFDSHVDMFRSGPPRPGRFNIRGDFPKEDGGTDWRLVLHGLEDDVITIRDVTEAEQISGKDSAP